MHDEIQSETREPLKVVQTIQRLHDPAGHGVVAQLDFSATPRDQQGRTFPETVVDHPLSQAIEDGIVKRPVIGELSATKPFLWSLDTFSATKSVFNVQPCGNELETRFCAFLDRCGDVGSFAKLARQTRFSLEYRGERQRLAYYYPDSSHAWSTATISLSRPRDWQISTCLPRTAVRPVGPLTRPSRPAPGGCIFGSTKSRSAGTKPAWAASSGSGRSRPHIAA